MKDLMTAPVTTLAPDDSLDLADEIMCLGGFRQLPVLCGRRLVGILTQRDILGAPGLFAPVLGLAVDTRAALKTLCVWEVMVATVVTIGADASLQDAAEQMLKHRVGCLPVLDGKRLVGIVTTSAVLRALAGPPGAVRDRSATAAIPATRGRALRQLHPFAPIPVETLSLEDEHEPRRECRL
jgi:CBS domain-containing protein